METNRLKQTCNCGANHFDVINQKKQQRNLVKCKKCNSVTNLTINKKVKNGN